MHGPRIGCLARKLGIPGLLLAVVACVASPPPISVSHGEEIFANSAD